ncbi:hypothetical protein CDCA_CDCA14G3898 [Cyanidium caldarium]|uniref:Transcription factor CBF/NF-Y/archaeal histone domain-containing protein n=1 Tax=Cyanidium caldarium TaxID=2771 RepID=A0AAV9J1H2_CYACA|nr:hypothetical protein CDCA_CDCA14G3898 [Cyanidium caldarium]
MPSSEESGPLPAPPPDPDPRGATDDDAMAASRRAIAHEPERFLPIANISRCMKNALPENAKISREAKELVQEATSEFISFITSESSDKCLRERRKTICGEDILYSMRTLGFEEYIGPLSAYLERFRATEQARKTERTGASGDEGPTDSDADAHEEVRVPGDLARSSTTGE